MSSEIIAALIGGGFALAGVAVGNLSARKTAKSQEQMRLLAEFYAEVFTEFSTAAPFSDIRKTLAFMSRLEKVDLLCSEESSKIITDLKAALAEKELSHKKIVDLYEKLRESAKKDLRQR